MINLIDTADALDELLYDLNQRGFVPTILVVDRCNIPALAYVEEVGGDDMCTGVTISGPRSADDYEGGRDRETSSLYYPVRVVFRPDQPSDDQPDNPAGR